VVRRKRYSEARKQQILDSIANGMTQQQAAKEYRVSVGSIQNWRKQSQSRRRTKTTGAGRHQTVVPAKSHSSAEFYATKLLEGTITKRNGVVSIDLKKVKDQGLGGDPLVVKILQDQLAKALK